MYCLLKSVSGSFPESSAIDLAEIAGYLEFHKTSRTFEHETFGFFIDI
jgi:hypothetical protein